VAPWAQGRGLGRAVLEALLGEAVRRGCGQVLLEVRADNGPAMALYHSRGFEQIALRRGYYAPGADGVVMRLRLTGKAAADG
jgi:ribosomal protein S18 acetylase RimI-like enzyme